jgi:recombination associated protein RdgC
MLNNIFCFNIKDTSKIPSVSDLSESLSNFTVPNGMKSFKQIDGWCPVVVDDIYAENIQNCLLMRLRIEKKSVPPKLLSEAVEEYMEDYLARTGSKMKKKEAKEEVEITMLAKALPSISYVEGYIDLDNSRLVVSTSSEKTAVLFCNKIKTAIGEFEVNFITDEPNFLVDKIKDAVAEKRIPMIGHNFGFGTAVKLKCNADNSNASIANEDGLIELDEFRSFVNQGKEIINIELKWMERYSFKITNAFVITGIKQFESVNQAIEENLGEDNDAANSKIAAYQVLIADQKDMITDLLNSKK